MTRDSTINAPPPTPAASTAGSRGTYVARRAGPSAAVAELGSMSTSLRERPPPRPFVPRLPREGRRRSVTRKLSERPRRPDSLHPEAHTRQAEARMRDRPGQGETGTETGQEQRWGQRQDRTDKPGQDRGGDRPGQDRDMQQKREESESAVGTEGAGRGWWWSGGMLLSGEGDPRMDQGTDPFPGVETGTGAGEWCGKFQYLAL